MRECFSLRMKKMNKIVEMETKKNNKDRKMLQIIMFIYVS